MLFKNTGPTPTEVAFSILGEATYLTENEAAMKPAIVPVVALDEGSNLVEYDYLKQMMQEAGIDLLQTRQAIAEVNGIDLSSLVTVVPDYELLINPSLKEEVGGYVLTSLSPDSDVYEFCEAMVSLYEDTNDESYLEALLEEVPASLIRALAADPTLKPAERHQAIESLKRKDRLEQERKAQQKEKQSNPTPSSPGSGMKRAFQITQAKFNNLGKGSSSSNNPGIGTRIKGGFNAVKNAITGKVDQAKDAWNNQSDSRKKGIKVALGTTIGAAVGAGIYAKLKRIRQEAASQPKSWIGKKISALRSIYTNYLQRARMTRDRGQASVFQQIASRILGVIDALMSRLQHAAG